MRTWRNLIAFAVFAVATSAMMASQLGRGGPGARSPFPGQPENVAPVAVQPLPPLTDLDTVLLTVSVTGQKNESVPGVPKERFRIEEDGIPQDLTYFYEDSRAMTVGFVFDDSARMNTNDKVYVLKDAAQSFLRTKNPADEYFVVRMSDFADVVVSFTTDVKDLPVNYPATGETALYDSVYVGLSVIKEAANPRKLLVVITSGGDRCCSDNNKRTTEQMLKAFALRQSVQIYPLFVVDNIEDADSEMVHRDSIVLSDLATMTGGRISNVPNAARGVEAYMAELARGLKTQYIVGYKSTNAKRDGKRRGVKVRVDSPEGAQRLSVWTKAGYYAPNEN